VNSEKEERYYTHSSAFAIFCGFLNFNANYFLKRKEGRRRTSRGGRVQGKPSQAEIVYEGQLKTLVVDTVRTIGGRGWPEK